MPAFRRLRALPLFASAAVLLSCEQVVVTTLDVDRVDVSPPTSFVRRDESTRLNVTVLSRDGRALSGRAVEWASLNPSIATVDETGMVLGLTPGVATIRAASEGVPGTATVTVTAGPAIAASPTEIDFAAVQNGASPGDKTVAITNGGDGTLSGLAANVRYQAGQPTGWLSATLSGNAPATLVLSATQAGLGLGTYTATVDVTSPVAGNSPISVTVRLAVLAPQPAIALGTTGVAFTAAEGAANPTDQNVGVTNAGGGSLTGLSASVSYGSGQPSGWLNASFASATAPTSLVLRATTGSLPQGIYTAQVQVSSPVAQNSPQTVNVTFTVGPALPLIRVTPAAFTFSAPKGGPNPPDSTAQVTNAGGASLTGLAVAVSYPGGQPSGWLVATLNGTNAPATLTVGARTGSLAVGTYTASVNITSAVALNSPQRLDVTFRVTEPAPAIAVDQGSLSFSTAAQLGDPAPATVAITNSGGGTLDGLTRSIAYGVGEPEGWLTADLSGTTAPTTLTVVARSTSLTPGTYNARVRLVSPQASNTADVNITFTVAAAAPLAPGSTTATPISDRRIDVTWQDRSANESRFDIERSTDGTTWVATGSVGANQTLFSDQSLTGSTLYFYRVSACNALGCAPNPAAATATTAPVAPSGLTATATSATTIDVKWSDNSPDETSFVLQRSADGGQSWSTIQTTGANVTSFTDANVVGSTTYRYRVRACRNALCSGFSNEAVGSPPTAPGTPGGLSASALSPTQVALRWNKPTGAVTSYNVERSPGGAGAWAVIGAAGDTTFTDGSAQPATAYDYRVQACFNSLCSSYSNVASVQTPATPQAPGAPGSLSAAAVAPDRIDIGWTAATGTVANYVIERRTAAGTYAPIATVAGTSLSHSDGSLSPATQYFYRVQACNNVGCSGFSNEANATTQAAPQAPSAPAGLSAAATSSTTIDLSWGAATGTVTSYIIERKTTAAGTYAAIGSVSGTTLSFQNSGLTPATDYFYRVQACNGTLCSGYSNEASATTQQSAIIPAPTSVAAAPVSGTQINVSWSHSGVLVTSFEIERALSTSPTNFTLVHTTGGGARSFSDSGLTAGTTYVYRVRACGLLSCSAWAGASATTSAPATPTGLSATATSSTQIVVQWNAPGGQTSYEVRRRVNGQGQPTIITVGGNATSLTDNGVVTKTTYTYEIRACGANGACSNYSGTASAITP